VIGADTGTPIKRVQVSLSAVPPPPTAGTGVPPGAGTAPRSITSNGDQLFINSQPMIRPKNVTTNAQGAFEFTQLPAGTYRIVASPGQYSAAYLGIAFGATKPNGPGSFDPGAPITLGDGQTFDKATIALPRGAVITGRVVDEDGQPLARVAVFGAIYLPGSSRASRVGSGAQTDDLGQFRMFGMPAGDYMVAAEARFNAYFPPNAPPETEEDKIGFMTTYYPGTGDEAGAQRVRTKAGTETTGIEIRMVTGRLYHVTGTAVDSQGRPLSRANVSLMKRVSTGGGTSVGAPTDPQGRFQMRNLPPGNYRLTVGQQVMGPMAQEQQTAEFTSIPLTINNDLDDILLTTSPGATISGSIVFEDGPPQTPSGVTSPLRVLASFGDPEGSMGAPLPPPTTVGPDLTFTMKGLAGELLLRVSASRAYVKAVQVGGENVVDTPHEFKNGDRVTFVLTSRASTVEGNVTDVSGKPVADANVIIFSDDKAFWRANSIRTHRAGVDANGHFRLAGLPSGTYFILAVPRERGITLTSGGDSSEFEALSKEATTLVVGEDEQRQVDLKVSAGGGL
jgi:protocatechuate 3,4-dioxygenase beta subunit